MYTHAAPLAPALDAIQNGQNSLSLYVDAILERIELVEPHVQALLAEPNRRARLRADLHALHERFPDPHSRPPLYGALVGIKDIFHVDGFETRAGSHLPPDELTGNEAAVVERLRAAGALIMGKTVTTEFAYFEPGPTRNPHNPGHTPGGSSSGSAAAVAAGECTLAVGTQTIGSVIRPAAYCGVVGFKPSFDRIPTRGLLYFSRSVDHVGLFTQDVAGMAIAAAALCNDWRTNTGEATSDPVLPVLGVPDGPYMEQADGEARYRFEEQMIVLAQSGIVVKRVAAFEEIAALNALHRDLIFREFADEHSALYARFSEHYRPRTVEIIEHGKRVSDSTLADARASVARLREMLEAQMGESGIDLWAAPAAPGPAPAGIHATGNPDMNLPWTHAGLPAITLPAGRANNGLPLGLQIIARFGSDERLINWANQLAPHLKEGASLGNLPSNSRNA